MILTSDQIHQNDDLICRVHGCMFMLSEYGDAQNKMKHIRNVSHVNKSQINFKATLSKNKTESNVLMCFRTESYHAAESPLKN